ncbi:AraC family transcriptional regulator [Kumtagia ephedrae]|uniref:AraC family transcriptional regulator n=1 Tax=Kumtagia ephedrae TaxID=2116701 RepID=A0A2P7S3B6_9HYPH|nr:AraC family transcriptional regulator [Mesorhizobium ephedrae]PSJ56975.1 AraC family transcriptional regulator [Mesorhizobium ephedrae]
MAAATIGRAMPVRYGGLEQFPERASHGGVDYCVAGSRPYALEFANGSDVVCLLLGDIDSTSRFDDGREGPLVFRGETSAFHPGRGNVRVLARSVRHGFVAFAYSDVFQEAISERGLRQCGISGSTNNIGTGPIRHLARYARDRIAAGAMLDPLEIQYLGGMVYVETMRGLRAGRLADASGLSDAAFRRIVDFIEAGLEGAINCESLAGVAGLPLRCVFDGIKARTGLSPYQFVISRRVERARVLLEQSNLPIADVALACGFASQQHLTTTLTRKLGRTPSRIRKN